MVVIVVVTVEDGVLVFSKAVSLSMLSEAVWKLFKVFVVVPTVMLFFSWSWTNTRSSSGVGGEGVEALEVRIVKGGWLSKMEGTTCSCCCNGFLSKVSNSVESCALVWKGAGMCTGEICEEELGRGQKEDDDDEQVLICFGTGLACAISLEVGFLSWLWRQQGRWCALCLGGGCRIKQIRRKGPRGCDVLAKGMRI